ncbi:MAG: alpha/beta fold hydrolase [Gemmatimonadaceae bacterium]
MWPVVVLMVAAIAALWVVRMRLRNIRLFESHNAKKRPVGANGLVLGAEPVFLSGSASRAVLLIHGFGDTPQSVRPLADALHAAGWTVSAILTPGHGRALRDYAAADASDWIGHAELSYRELKAQYATVVVCGISMGAALTAILAAQHPEIPAIVLLAPYLVMSRDMQIKTVLARLTSFAVPYHENVGGDRSIHDSAARGRTLGTGVVTGRSLNALRVVAKRAQAAIPRIKARVLYVQSREDNRIDANDAVLQFSRLTTAVKEQRWLSGCGHIITVDYCKDEVARQVIDWFAPSLSAGQRS